MTWYTKGLQVDPTTDNYLVSEPIVRMAGTVIPKIPKLGLGKTKFGVIGYKRISGYLNGPGFGSTTKLSTTNETWMIVMAADGPFDQVSVELPPSIAATNQAIWVIAAKAIGAVSDLNTQVDTTGYIRLSNATAGADTIPGVNGPIFGTMASSPFMTYETSQVGRIRSIPRTDGGTKPLIAIMVQFAPGITYSTVNYTNGSYAAAAEIWRTNPKNGDILLCNYSNSWTGPKFVTTHSYDFPIIGVNFGYLKPTYNVCRFGDSKMDGAGASIYKRDGFVRDQIEILRTQVPDLIINDMNFACPSIAQLCYPACLNYLTNSTKLPDMLVLPTGVVGNDNEGSFAVNHPIIRKIINICNSKNITLVLHNSGPVNVAVVNVQATDYQRVQNNLDYSPLVDMDFAAISSGANNGGQIEFAAGMSSDGIHESDLALALYGSAFLPYLASAVQGTP